MSHSPTISVIIATYNSSHTLKYTIKSLLNQTFQNFEAWIIGDCCSDDTKEIIDSFNDPRLNWHNRAENSGSQPAPNNEGIKRSKGKYIAYLGHDDLWMPFHLEHLLTHAETSQLDFTYATTLIISPRGIENIKGKKYIGVNEMDFVLPPSSWLHKSDLINKIGLWDENYLKLATPPDLNLLSRILSSSAKVSPTKKFSVIKFSSIAWRSYKNKEILAHEIEKYWERIFKNSAELENELLNEIVFEYSKFNLNAMNLPSVKIFVMIKRKCVNFFRKHLTGISIFKYIYFKRSQQKYQSSRKKTNIQRGLT